MNKLELKDVLSANVTALCRDRGFWWSDRQEANQKALERAIKKQRARLNQATISRVLHGDRMTKRSTLEALAAGLNVPAWLLLVLRLSAAERATVTAILALERAHEGIGHVDMIDARDTQTQKM